MPAVPLLDLDPRWVGAGGEGITDKNGDPVPARHGVGLGFNCPCGCAIRGYVAFENPLDGGPPKIGTNEPTWRRVGETFETLTLRPSIKRTREKGGCGWHGFITDGAVNGQIE
jgi:hypothetical protein